MLEHGNSKSLTTDGWLRGELKSAAATRKQTENSDKQVISVNKQANQYKQKCTAFGMCGVKY